MDKELSPQKQRVQDRYVEFAEKKVYGKSMKTAVPISEMRFDHLVNTIEYLLKKDPFTLPTENLTKVLCGEAEERLGSIQWAIKKGCV